MKTIDIKTASEAQKEQAARVMMEAFRHMPTARMDYEHARRDIDHLLEKGRLGYLALEDGEAWGVIGAVKNSAELWELDPLAVHPERQRRGIGAMLVRTLEEEAKKQGVVTMWLGTDDDFGGTNLYGVDLYPNVLEHLMNLKPATGHPYLFYQKMGYTVAGVVPDGSGPGMHDIIMTKRITR